MNEVTIHKNEVFEIIKGNLSIDIPVSVSTGQADLLQWYPAEIRSFLKKHLTAFQQNTVYFEQSFFEALKQSQPAIQSAIKKDADYMYSNLKYKVGVVIDPKYLNTFFFINETEKTITFLVTKGSNPVFGVCNQSLVRDTTAEGTKFYLSSRLSHFQHSPEIIKELNSNAYTCLMTSFFRTYADHEIKIVSNKSSAKLNNTVYKNQNKTNVLVLDSTWYTTLVRTEGFLVKGHLRMQACGKAFSERKLIYVDSFEKYGYVRKAKMLPQTNLSLSQIS